MDATGAFKTMLERLGYTEIEIKEAKLPKHVINFLWGNDETTDEEAYDTNPYFRVTSRQGNFGIVIAPYNLLDLKETGFTARDLGDIEASKNSFLISLNDITLQHLKRLLGAVKH